MARTGTLVVKLIGDATQLQSVGSKMTAVGKKLTTGLTLPIAAVGVAAVKAGMEYESAMATLQVATGASQKQMEQLDKFALKMGAQTTFSAGEAADAMVELAKAGLKPAQIQAGALQGAMALAATEGMELADASTVVVNSMAQFGLKASEASRVADVLAAGSKASTASVTSLSFGLRQVGPAAKVAGLSINDTVGALSLFDANALKGQDAGTSFKTFLTSLVPKTEKATNTLKDLGVKLTDREGNFKSLTAIAQELKEGFGGLSESERTLAIHTVFGSDAQRAANIMIDAGAKGLAKYISATRERGVAEEMAQARMSGMTGAIEQLKGSLETAAILLSRSLAPAVMAVANFVKGLADGFAGLSEETQKWIAVTLVVLASIGPLLMILGPLTTGIGMFASGLSFLIKLFMIWRGVASATVAANFALSASWVAVAAPVIIVVAALAALGVAFVLLYKKSETFRRLVQTAMDAVRNAAMDLVAWVRANWPGLVLIMTGPFGPIILAVVKFHDQIAAAFRTGIAVVQKIWDQFGGNIIAIAKTYFGMVAGVVRGQLKIVAGIVEFFTAVFKGDWSGAWKALQKIASGALDTLKAMLKGSLKLMWEAFKLYLKLWKTVVFDGMKAIAKIVLDKVTDAKDYVVDKFTDAKDFLATLVKETIPNVVKAGLKMVKNIFMDSLSGVIGLIRNFIATVVDKFLGFVDFLLDAADKAFGWIPGVGEKLDAARKEFDQFRANVNDAIRGIDSTKSIALKVIPDAQFKKLVDSGAGHPANTGNRAFGGPIMGGVPGKDSVPIMAMPGEHVWTASEVQKVGGQAGMYALRRMADQGALRQLAGMNIPHMAAGGMVRQKGVYVQPEGLKESVGAVRTMKQDVNEFFRNLVMFVKESALVGAGVAAALRWAKSQRGKPYLLGGVGPGAYDCSGFMSAITNHLRGYAIHSRVGSTASFPWPGFAPGFDPGGFTIGSTPHYPGSSMGHMAGTLGGVNVESSGGVGVRVGPGARGWNDPGFSQHYHLIGLKRTVGRGADTGALNRYEKAIIRAEAGGLFNTNANNPISSAFGLGQLLEANRIKYARQLGFNAGIERGDTGTRNRDRQIAMMRAYIRDRYGTSAAAWRFHQRHGVYDTGGVIPPGGFAFNNTTHAERVDPSGRPRRFVVDAPIVLHFAGRRIEEQVRIVIREEMFEEARWQAQGV